MRHSKRSSSVVAYSSVIAPDVKGKVSKMYRIEASRDPQQASKKRIRRERWKTALFFLADSFTTIYAAVVVILKYDDWVVCKKPFAAWLISVVVTSFWSTIFDFSTYSLVQKKERSSQAALTGQGKFLRLGLNTACWFRTLRFPGGYCEGSESPVLYESDSGRFHACSGSLFNLHDGSCRG